MTRRRRIWTLLAAAMMLFAALGATVPSQAQESTPGADDPGIETTRTTREEPTSTPDPATADEEIADPIDETAADAPAPTEPEGDIDPAQDLVVAQGLAVYDDFDEGKWWLTEIEPLSADEADSAPAPYFGFLLQIEGTTIIRNDVTGKRARVEAGEAYFYSQGDPYTRYADGSGSRAWLLEIVTADADADDAAGDVLYDSSADGEPFGDLPSAVRDFELTAGTLAQGESVDVPEGDAPSLVVLLSGRLAISDGRTLRAPAGFAFPESVTLTNEETVDARYYVATLSSEVISDEAPAAAEPTSADAADDADEAEATVDPDGDADGDGDGTPTAADIDETPVADADDADGDGWLIENDGTDTDGDTIPDDVEVAIGTDPNNADTDGDFLKDWEELNFTSPLFADSDGDGWDDYAEAITYGTDPNDPNDFPAA